MDRLMACWAQLVSIKPDFRSSLDIIIKGHRKDSEVMLKMNMIKAMCITFNTNSPYVRSSGDYVGNPNKLFPQLQQDNRDLGGSAQKNV